MHEITMDIVSTSSQPHLWKVAQFPQATQTYHDDKVQTNMKICEMDGIELR